jgi:hypothetical protein
MYWRIPDYLLAARCLVLQLLGVRLQQQQQHTKAAEHVSNQSCMLVNVAAAAAGRLHAWLVG